MRKNPVALTEAGIETLLLQFQLFKEGLRRFERESMPRVRELQSCRADQVDIGNSSGDYDSAEQRVHIRTLADNAS